VQNPHVPAGFLVTFADLFAQVGPKDFARSSDFPAQPRLSCIDVCPELMPDCRKLLAHLTAQLSNLQFHSTDSFGQTFQQLHLSFEIFHPFCQRWLMHRRAPRRLRAPCPTGATTVASSQAACNAERARQAGA
jgi:hypothetical protein